MKLPTASLFASTFLLLPVLAACSSSTSSHRSALDNSTGSDRSFASPKTPAPSSLDASQYTPHSPRPASAQRLGLFGELSASPSASTPIPDGASNLTQITMTTEGACFDPDVDRSGSRIVFASTMHKPTADLYLKSVLGKTVTQLTSDPADEVMPAFSPDGQRVAFASNRSGNWDIFITSLDGGGTVQITSDFDAELHPSFSPDGRLLAYCKLSAQSSRWQIYVVDLLNPGVKRYLQDGMFPQWNPNPDQPSILFQQARQRGSRFHSIWTLQYINGEALHPTEIVSASNAAAINPAWSPDGSMIAFVTIVDPQDLSSAQQHQVSDLWIVNVDGSGRTELTNSRCANYQPVWASDGAIYFVSDRAGNDNIWAAASGRSTFMAGRSDLSSSFTSADPDQHAPSSDAGH